MQSRAARVFRKRQQLPAVDRDGHRRHGHVVRIAILSVGQLDDRRQLTARGRVPLGHCAVVAGREQSSTVGQEGGGGNFAVVALERRELTAGRGIPQFAHAGIVAGVDPTSVGRNRHGGDDSAMSRAKGPVGKIMAAWRFARWIQFPQGDAPLHGIAVIGFLLARRGACLAGAIDRRHARENPLRVARDGDRGQPAGSLDDAELPPGGRIPDARGIVSSGRCQQLAAGKENGARGEKIVSLLESV